MLPQPTPVPGSAAAETELFELRLFLEEICCNICRFRHVHDDKVSPEHVRGCSA
jgi:hypothetical protein